MAVQLKGFIRGEWNWPISCLNGSETQGVEIPKNIPGEACPRTPLETYPFGARLENRSVFILDPPRDAVARRHLMCKMKQNWMQGWHYGKGLIY